MTVLARGEVSEDAGLLVLWHENTVLRRQVSRVCYQPGGRLWLAALSRLVPRRRWDAVSGGDLATLLALHRQLVARRRYGTSRRRPGWPARAAAIRRLVIRMAADNPRWGHRGCAASWSGSAAPIAACMVWQILHDAGIGPAPRPHGPGLEAVPDRPGPRHSRGLFRPHGQADQRGRAEWEADQDGGQRASCGTPWADCLAGFRLSRA